MKLDLDKLPEGVLVGQGKMFDRRHLVVFNIFNNKKWVSPSYPAVRSEHEVPLLLEIGLKEVLS